MTSKKNHTAFHHWKVKPFVRRFTSAAMPPRSLSDDQPPGGSETHCIEIDELPQLDMSDGGDHPRAAVDAAVELVIR